MRRYDKEQSKKKWAPVLYGDGTRAQDHKLADAYLLSDDAAEDTGTPEQRAPAPTPPCMSPVAI